MIFETSPDERAFLRWQRWLLACTSTDLDLLLRAALRSDLDVARWIVHVDAAIERAGAVAHIERTLGAESRA
ncbi:MAG: hypothetical protein IT377_27785 [Polyangiaceae bacterium]|nr:hypothetical protein [Polyangiaceae bacterium]